MKNLFPLLPLLLINLFLCQFVFSQTCLTNNLSHANDRYKKQENFKPLPSDGVKILRLNLHIMQYKVGDERNFRNIPAHIDYLNRVIDSLNSGARLLREPDFPQTCVCGNDCYIADIRIRYELQGIYFHLDSNNCFSSSGGYFGSNYPKNNQTEWSYYINADTSFGGRLSPGGSPSYSILSQELRNVGAGYFKEYVDNEWIEYNGDSINNWHYTVQRMAGNMQHEISHGFGLLHLYDQSGACCLENINPSNIDYIWDFWGTGQPGCLTRLYGNTHDCKDSVPSDTCVINWMGGNQSALLHRGLTPMQIGRMHRATMLSSIRKYFKPTTDYVANHLITQNETWDFNIRMYGHIVVRPGATLTIKCKVLMPPYGKIIVEPGGILEVDGGTITSVEPGSNNFWQGIVVEGTSLYSQYGTTPNGYPHGVVVLKNGAVIQDAIEGVATKDINGSVSDLPGGGGIVKAYNSTFLNCQKGIFIGPFNETGGQNNKPNLSYIKNCTFKVDSNWIGDKTLAKRGIILFYNDGIKIDSCNFLNSSPSYFIHHDDYGDGIWAIDASSQITHCNFNTLHRGLCAGKYLRLNPILAQYNTFEDNYFGSFLLGGDLSVVQQNTYLNNSHGLVIHMSKGFKVSENSFEGGTTGIVCESLAQWSNQLYNNDFEDLEKGIQTQGYTPFTNTGLSFKCNAFESNTLSD